MKNKIVFVIDDNNKIDNNNNNNNNIDNIDNNNNNNNNNNNIDSNNNNNIDNSNLFFKVWRNKYLKKKIYYYIKKTKYYGKRHYLNIKSYNNSKDKFKYESISIGDVENYHELLKFVKECPKHLKSIEFANLYTKVSFNLDSLIIAPTLRQLKFNTGVTIVDSDPAFTTLFGKLFSSVGIGDKHIPFGTNGRLSNLTSLTNLTSLQLGENSCQAVLSNGSYPSSLTSLTINHKLKSSIIKGMLPETLERFTLNESYPYSTIYLPSRVKYVSLGLNEYYYVNPNILSNIPSSCTNLKLLFDPQSSLCKPLNNQLAASIKKLIIVNDKKSTEPPFYLNSNITSLTSLDISNISNAYSYTIDIGLLPSTILKLKLPPTRSSLSPVVVDYKSIGFPSSLTSLHGSQSVFIMLFQNYSNIRSIGITFNLNEQSIIKYHSKFPNLKSICFNATSINQVFNNNNNNNDDGEQLQLPLGLENLEINSNGKDNDSLELLSSYIQQLKSFNSLKSLKLNSYLSSIVLDQDRIESIFPSNIKVLYLKFNDQYININQPLNIQLSNDPLPELKVLIIETRSSIEINFKSQLPSNLKYLFLSSRNLSTTSTFKSNNKLRYFNSYRDYPLYNKSKSYLFNKFKKIYI